MDDGLASRRTVAAPIYMAVLRISILDIRGFLHLHSDCFRWRPSGWYGRLSGRAPAFEVPLNEIDAVRLHRRRLLRSTLVFEDLGGGEIYADGNTTPIPLEVKAQEAVAALSRWGWVRDPELDGAMERWRAPTP